MTAPVTQEQYTAAQAAVSHYAGKDVGQLTSDERLDLANNLAVMARFQDSTSVYGSSAVVLQNLGTIFSDGIVPSTVDFSTVQLPPPSAFDQGAIDAAVAEFGNAWFTPSMMASLRINSQDLLAALKEVHVISEQGGVDAVKAFIDAKMQEAQDIQDSAKKEAEMAKWAMIGAIVGIAAGVGSAAGGGVASKFGGKGFFSGVGSSIDVTTRIGQSIGSIIENGAKVGLLVDKGAIDADRVMQEAAATLAQKAMQSNKEMADAAADLIRSICDNVNKWNDDNRNTYKSLTYTGA